MDLIPDETLSDIFAYFEGDLPLEKWWMYGAQLDASPLKTLLSISRTCRRFHRVAQHLIHRTIPIEAFEGDDNRFALLARTLVFNPQLRRSVRVITLNEDFQYGHRDFEDALRSTWLSLDAPLPFKKKLGREVAHGRMLGLEAIVLALTPQVRLVDYTYHGQGQCTMGILSGRPDLEMPLSEDSEYPELGEDEMAALKAYERERGGSYANYRLPKLEELRIRTGDCTDGNTTIDELEPALLHPNLKTLRLHGINWLGGPISNLKFLNEPCNLESLDLKEGVFDHLSLENILTRCKKLKWLSMETGDCRRHDDHDQEWEIDLEKFGNVLRRLGRNLEYFNLHTIEYESDGYCEGRLGSLRDLTALRHLKVILNNFTGRVLDPWDMGSEHAIPLAEALPPSIETLHLHWDDMYYDHNSYKRYCDNINGAVFKLMMAKGFPNLQRISIERHGGDRDAEEFDKSVDGWRVEVRKEHLWETYACSGCMRTLIYLTKEEL